MPTGPSNFERDEQAAREASASPLAAAAFATEPATRRESATPNWARAQAERTRTLRQSFGDSLGGGAEARKEIREAQAREAEARRERAEAARREERSRRRVHDTFFGRAHMI